MVAIAVAGIALGGVVLRATVLDSHAGLAAYAAGVGLAALFALAGFAVLGWGLARGAEIFRALLLGTFLGRVVLVGLFGLVVYALAPAHLATALLSLVAFHFIFAVTEIALLAGSRAVRRDTRAGARTAAQTHAHLPD